MGSFQERKTPRRRGRTNNIEAASLIYDKNQKRRSPGTDDPTKLSLVYVRVSVAQAFGGENDQRESSCDRRTVSRWNFAGAGAERSRNGQRTAGSRRRCGQSHSRCAGVWSPGSSRDERPQKHLHVGKEPQRLKDEYHQVAASKKSPVGVAPASLSGALF